jgi:DNA-binding MarR family transcriptional regulator
MHSGTREERDQRHARVYHQIKTLFQIEDMSGVEVISSLGRINQIVELLDSHFNEDGQAISGPRFRLMLHLFLAEQLGKPAGLTPTEISQFLQVSKNTISALLRGLEEQGYIVRELDADDLRIFHIHLSDSGRRLVLESTPRRILSMNQMLRGLTEPEIHQLVQLLAKLSHSLEDQFCVYHQKDFHRSPKETE